MNKRALLQLSIVGVAMMLVCPADAWAYVDPGTGSYLFQILIAGGLAASYSLRRYWDALKAALLGKREPSSGASSQTPDGMV
jgi:hypothetical protein